MKKLSLSLLPPTYAVCQLHPDKHIPYWALLGDFVSLTRTPEELPLFVSRTMYQKILKQREDGDVCRCRELSTFQLRVLTPRWLFHWPMQILASLRLLLLLLITYWLKKRILNGLCWF